MNSDKQFYTRLKNSVYESGNSLTRHIFSIIAIAGPSELLQGSTFDVPVRRYMHRLRLQSTLQCHSLQISVSLNRASFRHYILHR